VVSFTPRSLYPPYPLARRLRGPQSLSGRREEEKILDRIGTRTPDPSVVHPVASRHTDYADENKKKMSLYGLNLKTVKRQYIYSSIEDSEIVLVS
jgi:hypothetical protein